MLRNVRVQAIATVLAGLSVTAVADEAADTATKELAQRFAQVQSYTAQVETLNDFMFRPDRGEKTIVTGPIEWRRQSEKALMRSVDTRTETKVARGQTTTTTATITTVSDGEVQYVLTEENGEKTLAKSGAPALQTYSPEGYFEQFGKLFDIKLAPDAQVNGAECYVFEMRLKPMENLPPSGRQFVYFHKQHGIQVKSETYDPRGKLTRSVLLKDLKVNVDISPDRFKFEVPDDAKVTDTTP